MTMRHVLILGAGSAGLAAARALAAHDNIRVTAVTRTGETPYTRMSIKNVAFGPLSPQHIALPLPPAEVIADTVEHVDIEARQVHLASGTRTGFDALIIATGSRPRVLADDIHGVKEAADAERLSPLHALDDALRVRARLTGFNRRARVAIYGGGVLAAETASTLRSGGHQVILIARSAVPGAAAFGTPIAERLAAAHAAKVSTHFGRRITRLATGDDGIVITLDDQTAILADILLLALGTTPAPPTPWTDGIAVDSHLRTETPRIYSAGGVAIHHHDTLGAWRIDHWEDAAAQGTHAALVALHDLGAGDDPGAYLPRSRYAAMVYGQVIAGVGLTSHPGTPPDDGDFVVRHESGGTVVGVSGIDAIATVHQWGARLHQTRR